MNHRNPPERRTFLQDRFDILIKRQKLGTATFSELTELDEIVNRDPELREKVIRENILMEGMDDFEEPAPPADNGRILQTIKRQGVLQRIKSWISRVFNAQILTVKATNQVPRSALLSF
jgi:hypothetical protein